MTDGTPGAANSAAPILSRGSGSSFLGDVWRNFCRHRGGVIGLAVLLTIVALVVLGPYFYTVEVGQPNYRARNQGPSWDFPLGTDNLGRDLLAQLLTGGRTTLAVGISAMLLSLVIGTLVGVFSGYWRRLDGPLMRLTDLFLALPILPLLLVAVMLFRDTLRTAFGPETGVFILLVTVIGVTSWMHTARIVRGDVLALKRRDFITAAQAGGTRETTIVLQHLLPNVVSSIMVSATLGIATAIITESALSFLGLGFPSDYPTWGRLLFDGVNFIQITPTRVLWPGLAISLVVLSVNYVGDAIRDALDPRALGR
ncbi:ABC transporter permease [Halotalea alkalilenta]|uniref:ABC transporter permease n=1 Tax=Halotalea alkalilenta TaxID=376489 RepID=UPI000481A8A6|nr:ABC transporter permease [Halotalea alkalilenta]